MDIKNTVMKVKKSAELLGWKSSDGGIHAFYLDEKDCSGVFVSVDYNNNKLSKRKAAEAGRKIFGKRFIEIIDVDKHFFIVALVD